MHAPSTAVVHVASITGDFFPIDSFSLDSIFGHPLTMIAGIAFAIALMWLALMIVTGRFFEEGLYLLVFAVFLFSFGLHSQAGSDRTTKTIEVETPSQWAVRACESHDGVSTFHVSRDDWDNSEFWTATCVDGAAADSASAPPLQARIETRKI